jgi:SM-20-related protein
MIYNEAQWLLWMDVLAEDDFVIIDDFLSLSLLADIQSFFDLKLSQNIFTKAAVGQGSDRQEIATVRGDFVYWLNREIDLPLAVFFDLGDEMILNFNQHCFLNLKSSEFHLAEYPTGSFYKKHMDQFEGSSNRLITFLLYLNENWVSSDEGQLRIYSDGGIHRDIAPINNRCLLFKSDKILHEVLPTTSKRRSLTGWLLYQP